MNPMPAAVGDQTKELPSEFDATWYHTIELKPGMFSPGMGHLNTGLTRALLAHCDVDTRRCLDLGAMEGLLSVIMARRGGRVTAVDGFGVADRIELVRRSLGVHFDYHPFVGSMDLVDYLETFHRMQHAPANHGDPRERRSIPPLSFDIIVASGLMYHLWSPLHLLGAARTLIRPGGIFILESAFLHSESAAMTFNFDGSKYIYPHASNTWFLTDTLLDHLLRLFHFKPLDCVHYFDKRNTSAPGRIAVACRAIDGVLPDQTDSLMADMTSSLEFTSLLRRTSGPGLPVGEVPYTSGTHPIKLRQGTGSCDLFETCQTTPQFPLNPRHSILSLGELS